MAKQAEVKVGQVWTARVSGQMVRVRVDSVNKPSWAFGCGRWARTKFGLTNLNTGQQLASRTGAFLRKNVSTLLTSP